MAIEIIMRGLRRQTYTPEDIGTYSPEWRGRIEEIQREYQTDRMPVVARAGGPDPTVTEGQRIITGWPTTESVDHSGDVVVSAGMIDRKRVSINVAHDYHRYLPIGRSLTRKVAEVPKSAEMTPPPGLMGVIATGKYSERTQLAREVFDLTVEGIMLDLSIGFIPVKGREIEDEDIDAHPHWEGARWIHEKWVMLEYSHVSIGDNPDAVVTQVTKAAKIVTDAHLRDYLAEIVDGMQTRGRGALSEYTAPATPGRVIRTIAEGQSWRETPGALVGWITAGPAAYDDLRYVTLSRHGYRYRHVSGVIAGRRIPAAIELVGDWPEPEAKEIFGAHQIKSLTRGARGSTVGSDEHLVTVASIIRSTVTEEMKRSMGRMD